MPPADARAPFGRPGPRRPDLLRRLRALAVLLLMVVAVLLGRSLWRLRVPLAPALIVEVAGAVEQPGLHELPPGATPRLALDMAGPRVAPADDPFLDLPLHDGYRVELGDDGGLRVWLADERLLVGLPVDVNLAAPEILAQLPGIGPALAGAIIEDRESRGPFSSLDELGRVEGIGPATLARLRPFLEVGDLVPHPPHEPSAPPPLDLNTAGPAALEALPGIGPVLAAAIVADREARGPFASPADLARVKGIGAITVERLAPLVVTDPTSRGAEP